MYNANSSLVKTVYIEITAKAFMRGQIRIMISTCLKYARDQITFIDLQNLLSVEDYTILESGKMFHKESVSPFGLYLSDI